MRVKPLGVLAFATVFFLCGAISTFLIMSNHIKTMVEREHNKQLLTQIPETYADYAPVYDKAVPAGKPANLSTTKALEPLTIYFEEYAVPYINGGKEEGQRIIDTTEFASTWGAAPIFDGNDNQNTHFIGHIGVQFHDIQNENWITVTDAAGNPTHYYVTDTYIMDDRTLEISTRESREEAVLGKGDVEKITLQTCITEDLNWIVEAKRMP